MKRSLGIILLLTTATSGMLFLQLGAQPSLPWSRHYEAALGRASETRQPLLVYLYTDWCAYCAQMERDTFSNPAIIDEMGPRFQWVKLNAEQDPAGIRLREEHGLANYPSIFILDPEAREIDRLTGFMGPAKFQTQVDAYLHGPGSLIALQQRVKEHPEAVDAHYSLGQKFLTRGDFSGAARHFSIVLELDPENQHQSSDAALYYWALARASASDESEALELAKQLEERFPESGFLPDGAILAGRIYYYGGERKKASEVFNAYLKRFPDHQSTSWVARLVSEIDEITQK